MLLGFLFVLGCLTHGTLCRAKSTISVDDYKVFLAVGSTASCSASAHFSGAPALGTTLDIGTTMNIGGTLFSIERDQARLNIGAEYTTTNSAQSSSRNLWNLYFTTSSIDRDRFILTTFIQQVQKLHRQNFAAQYSALENYLHDHKKAIGLIKSINAVFGFGNSDCKKSGFTYRAFNFFFGLLFHLDSWMALEVRILCTARENDFDFLTGNSARNAMYKLDSQYYIHDPDTKGSIGISCKAVFLLLN